MKSRVSVCLFSMLLFSVAFGKPISSRKEPIISITKAEFNSMFSNAKIVISFKIESIFPRFPIDDMPNGYNKWQLHGDSLKVNKGTLKESPKKIFETEVLIYDGPTLSRPTGFWVNQYPKSGETWVIFSTSGQNAPSINEIFQSNIGSALEFNRVKKFLTSKIKAKP